MHQVSRYEEMLYKMDTKMFIMNKTIQDIMMGISFLWYESNLSEDPETNIWAYYGNVKLTPIILQDYLMLILTVPLVDQSLQMELYKVYNLPMLHPTLHMHA